MTDVNRPDDTDLDMVEYRDGAGNHSREFNDRAAFFAGDRMVTR